MPCDASQDGDELVLLLALAEWEVTPAALAFSTFGKVLTEDHTVEDGRARLLRELAEQQTTPPARRADGTRSRSLTAAPVPAPAARSRAPS
ncbi:hypothetical protein [Streptomyces sp. NPDC088812]|uniref:hypothetical protein n=1 Tax=Streptomyces sp. NPDC088812 TaxID=3365905 RepID=UPI00382642F1